MGNIKQNNIKNRTYYFFNDMINSKDFDSILQKIDKKSYKNIGIYNIGYITTKKINDSENIHSANTLYLMISKVIGNKYLIFDSIDENKELLKKYKELWDGIKNKVESMNDGECKYGKDFTKTKFYTDGDLPLNKPLSLYILTIIVRSVFEDEGKFYAKLYLDECFYEL